MDKETAILQKKIEVWNLEVKLIIAQSELENLLTEKVEK
jgi:hypothetical protein